MLMPKRTKYRKMMRGRMTGKANRGAEISFGEFALQATGTGLGDQPPDRSGPPRDHQLPQARRQGLDPHLSRQAGHAEAGRDPHGIGKGNPEYWVAVVKPGRIMFEVAACRERGGGGSTPRGDEDADGLPVHRATAYRVPPG